MYTACRFRYPPDSVYVSVLSEFCHLSVLNKGWNRGRLTKAEAMRFFYFQSCFPLKLAHFFKSPT